MIIVCGAHRAAEHLNGTSEVAVAGGKIVACISIDESIPLGSHGRPHEALAKAKAAGTRVLELTFDDITRETACADDITPSVEHVREVLAFGEDVGWEQLEHSDDEHLLIHCAAGKSRSPSMCLALVCQKVRRYRRSLRACYSDMRVACEHLSVEISPNACVVEIVDELLRFEGALVKLNRELKVRG